MLPREVEVESIGQIKDSGPRISLGHAKLGFFWSKFMREINSKLVKEAGGARVRVWRLGEGKRKREKEGVPFWRKRKEKRVQEGGRGRDRPCNHLLRLPSLRPPSIDRTQREE